MGLRLSESVIQGHLKCLHSTHRQPSPVPMIAVGDRAIGFVHKRDDDLGPIPAA
jgi:hypothetical protein